MRARLALSVSGVRVALREVLLRDKAPAFLAASPSATVPCLQLQSRVIDESHDIMLWALGRNDPQGWLDMPIEGHALIAANDGPFKTALDRYKYASRHTDADPLAERSNASDCLRGLDQRLQGRGWLFGNDPTLADMAILPFVRQFAHVDPDWFTGQPWPDLIRWLDAFKTSDRFAAIMPRYAIWQDGDAPIYFP